MKKIMNRLFIVFLALALPILSASADNGGWPRDYSFPHGDAVLDRQINIVDVMQLIDHILRDDTYINEDVDGNLVVDISDVTFLIDYLLGIETEWPWLYKGPEIPDSALVFTVNGVSFAMMPVEGTDHFNPYYYPSPDEGWGIGDCSVRDFYIGQTPVTQELWKAVMGSLPDSTLYGFELYPTHPIDYVNWFDCMEFIERLNELTGREFHLPNIAQWRYAATGGKWSHQYEYAGSNDPFEVAWTGDNQPQGLKWNGAFMCMPVGLKKPNELGLYDMSGNMHEWAYNFYPADGDTFVPMDDWFFLNVGFVLGGSMDLEPRRCRIYANEGHDRAVRGMVTFRLALQMED